MKNLSTQCVSKMMKKGKNPYRRTIEPRKQTLSILRQFARVYHVEHTMQEDLCVFVLN
jgi:hypothetical protein